MRETPTFADLGAKYLAEEQSRLGITIKDEGRTNGKS
jgi:hypothetical protein